MKNSTTSDSDESAVDLIDTRDRDKVTVGTRINKSTFGCGGGGMNVALSVKSIRYTASDHTGRRRSHHTSQPSYRKEWLSATESVYV